MPKFNTSAPNSFKSSKDELKDLKMGKSNAASLRRVSKRPRRWAICRKTPSIMKPRTRSALSKGVSLKSSLFKNAVVIEHDAKDAERMFASARRSRFASTERKNLRDRGIRMKPIRCPERISNESPIGQTLPWRPGRRRGERQGADRLDRVRGAGDQLGWGDCDG